MQFPSMSNSRLPAVPLVQILQLVLRSGCMGETDFPLALYLDRIGLGAAPPSGLFLECVRYPGDAPPGPLSPAVISRYH